MSNLEPGREYATLRDLHKVETNITQAITNLRLHVETCTLTVNAAAGEALKVALEAKTDAAEAKLEVSRVHKRINKYLGMSTKFLISLVLSLLAAGWALWKAVLEIKLYIS